MTSVDLPGSPEHLKIGGQTWGCNQLTDFVEPEQISHPQPAIHTLDSTCAALPNMLAELSVPGGTEKPVKKAGFRLTIKSSTLSLLVLGIPGVVLQSFNDINMVSEHLGNTLVRPIPHDTSMNSC